MLRSKILLFILVCNVISYAQDSSKTVLNFEEFIGIVREHHPLAFAANLQSEKGAATLTKARGGFDPKLFGTVDQKYYDDKQYFSYVHAGLKIPTWFGISVDGGYDLNEGAYLNPSSRVPDNGLWYAGLNITLAKGLLIDDRRAELQQAKIYQESAQMEQRIMLNQLYYDASTAYWENLSK